MKKTIYILMFLFLTCGYAAAQWQCIYNSGGVSAIEFKTDNQGILSGSYGSILKSSDGGAHWDSAGLAPLQISDIYYVPQSDTVFFICNRSRDIYRSINSGSTWTVISNQADTTSLYGKIAFINGSVGFLGYGLTRPNEAGLKMTTDCGVNWQLVSDIPDSLEISGISMIGQTGFVSAGHYIWQSRQRISRIYKTIDGGNHWTNILEVTLEEGEQGGFWDLEFTSQISGYYISDNKIYKTNDGGINWKLSYELLGNPNPYLFEVKFKDENTGYACANDYIGTPFNVFTTDKGVTWHRDIDAPRLEGLSWGGNILYGYNNGGGYKLIGTFTGVVVNEEIMEGYNLYQNYPNPFNPVTKINFSIPKSGIVTLKIYDINGKEIATLINETKAAGDYSIDFNATSLSSGTYFYRIETNDYVETKKMLLIK